MKRLGVFLLLPPPLDAMLVQRRVTSNIKFAGTHLYTWFERPCQSVLSKNATKYPRPGLEHGNGALYCSRAFAVSAPELWNKLRDDIRSCGNLILVRLIFLIFFFIICMNSLLILVKRLDLRFPFLRQFKSLLT